ncbi:Hypothetical_protein [Hexamita inflata]|uniref:Hypothetical_protein n=1 Tax=Hexamita inflata TaxID=28002 RepID=A0AA86U1M2_9EUKA|nr:Hypothetical protein HINF_LOCUS24361 [Hexamita inflata]
MSSIVDGYSEPVRSSIALGFAFLPCSHTLEAWRRSRCPSSGSLTVSLTLLRRDGAFMQSISDQAGVMQLGFFVSAPLQGSSVCLGRSRYYYSEIFSLMLQILNYQRLFRVIYYYYQIYKEI